MHSIIGFIQARRLVRVLGLALSVPVLLALALVGAQIWQQNTKYTKIIEVNDVVQFSRIGMDLVDALSRERTAALPFVATRGKDGLEAYQASIVVTDQVIEKILVDIQNLRAIEINDTITKDLDLIVEALANIATLRQDTQVITYSAFDVIELYSAINQIVIDFVEGAVAFSDHAEVSHSLVTSVYLLNATEYFAMEHALGAGAFQVGRWDKTNIAQLGDITKRRAVFFKKFERSAPPEQAEMYQTMVSSEPYQSMLELRDIVVAWGQFGNFQGYDQAQFIEIYNTVHGDLRSLGTKALDEVLVIIDDKIARIWGDYMTILWGALAAVIATIAIAGLLVLVLRAQVARLVDAAKEMAGGNLDITLPRAHKNELGALIIALAVFRDETRKAQKFEDESRAKALQEASEASQQAKEKLEQSRYVASELERAATAIEQLSHSVNVAAEMADQARTKSTSIKDKSDRGTQTVKTAIAAMGDIRNSSNEISNITKLIDEISFQTNLLALNARVEAARAGAAGRGFAVVAAEVQQLAARSAKAASDISELIVQSTKQVQYGSEVVNKSGEALDDIADGIFEVAEVIQNVSATVREQSTAIGEINKTTAAIDDTLKTILSDAA